MRQEVPEDFEKRLAGTNWPAVLGSDKFKEKIKQLILGKNLSEISSKELMEGFPAGTIEETLNMFLKYFKMTIKQYHKKQEGYYKVRDFTIRYCRETLNYKNVDIAKILGVSVETISRSYRIVNDDRQYNEIIKKQGMLKLQI